MESRLNNQILILFRQLVTFCESWILCSKLPPSQEREALAEFKHGSKTTNTRWRTIGFKRQHSSQYSQELLWIIAPVLALLNTFLSRLDRGMECTLSKYTDQTNRASMWKATAFLHNVSEAIVSSFTSSRRGVRSKKRCELSRGLQRWVGLEPLPVKWDYKIWACPAWRRDGFTANLTAT